MDIYLISGLGADERAFRHLRLPQGCTPIHLSWLPPSPGETLPGYARRLSERIDTQRPFGLVGLSFGGMIAVEIARLLFPRVVVLISSIACPAELPFYFQWAGRLRLHRVVPMNWLRNASIFKRNFTRETRSDKDLLSQMIRDSDPAFIRWALNAILTWRSPALSTPLLHIHGSGDGILPCRFVHPTHTVRGGGHLMVMTRAREINAILKEVLSPYFD